MTRTISGLVILSLVALVAACGGSSGDAGGSAVAPAPAPAPPRPPFRASARPTRSGSSIRPRSAPRRPRRDRVDRARLRSVDRRATQRPASLELPHVQVAAGAARTSRTCIATASTSGSATRCSGPISCASASRSRCRRSWSSRRSARSATIRIRCASLLRPARAQGLGNFRELMEAVTLHPAMGVYLSMLGNQKPNPAAQHPSRRELRARADAALHDRSRRARISTARRRLDGAGQPIPTYDQPIIEGFAHVYTGWTYAGERANFASRARRSPTRVRPMQLYPERITTRARSSCSAASTIPAGQSGAQDLDAALDNIFDHPNVGPFIAQRLIQRLVTSNPSPAYVSRVRATLQRRRPRRARRSRRGRQSDPARSRSARRTDARRRGKLKEPLLRLTQLWRAYDGAPRAAATRRSEIRARLLGQGPLQAPSVFNFFSPFYAPPGEIRDPGLVAPELRDRDGVSDHAVDRLRLRTYTFNRNSRTPGLAPEDIVIDHRSRGRASPPIPTHSSNLVADKLLGRPDLDARSARRCEHRRSYAATDIGIARRRGALSRSRRRPSSRCS